MVLKYLQKVIPGLFCSKVIEYITQQKECRKQHGAINIEAMFFNVFCLTYHKASNKQTTTNEFKIACTGGKKKNQFPRGNLTLRISPTSTNTSAETT